MRRVIPVLLVLAATATGCKSDTKVETEASTSPSVAVSAEVTASHDTPDGAMRGLLAAMDSGDNDAVLEWVSPEPASDRTSITGTVRLGSALGLGGGVFWLVGLREITNVETKSETEAEVTLDGYIVWCTGEGEDDEKASCAQPNGAGDEQTTTYPVVKVDGQWYVHLDLNHGQLIKGNPGAAGVAA